MNSKVVLIIVILSIFMCLQQSFCFTKASEIDICGGFVGTSEEDDSGDYIFIPVGHTLQNISYSIIKMNLLDKNNNSVTIKNPVVFQYFNETLTIKDNNEVDICISVKMIFEDFFLIDDDSSSDLEEKEYIRFDDYGIAKIPSGSLRIMESAILVSPSVGFARKIKEIKNVSVSYEKKGPIPSHCGISNDGGSFYILLESDEKNFTINETAILLDINYVVENGVIDSFFSNDMVKKIMIVNYFLDYYAFSVNITINLPKESNLISAENLRCNRAGDKLSFKQCITSPNNLKSFTIEYLSYRRISDRLFSDPLSWVWAFIGGMIGAVISVMIMFSYNKFQKDRKKKKKYYYRNKSWLETELRKGRTIEETAEKCGVIPKTINNWIIKHGIIMNRES